MRHYHIWYFERDDDGIIRRAVRTEDTYSIRGKANYELSDRRRYWTMGRVLACDDSAFCKPPPPVSVTGLSISGHRVTHTGDKVVSDQKSIGPSRKQVLSAAAIEDYESDPYIDVEWDSEGATER